MPTERTGHKLGMKKNGMVREQKADQHDCEEAA